MNNRNILQIVCMWNNSGETLLKAMDTWKYNCSQIVLVNAGKCTDNTEALLANWKLYNSTCNLKMFKIAFQGFSKSRNKSLDLAFNNKYRFTMMLDDSYTLNDDFLEDDLEGLTSNIKCIEIYIKTHEFVYNHRRIIRTNSKLRWTGRIHEYIDSNSDWQRPGVTVLDLYSEGHKKRTEERLYYDLGCLHEPRTTRELYQKALIYYKMYSMGLMDFDTTLKTFQLRFLYSGGSIEEDFMTCIFIGNLWSTQSPEMVQNAVRAYITASEIFPNRCGECYLFIYLITNLEFYLLRAYKNKFVGEFRLPVDLRIYSNTSSVSVIDVQYHKHFLRKSLMVIKSQSYLLNCIV